MDIEQFEQRIKEEMNKLPLKPFDEWVADHPKLSACLNAAPKPKKRRVIPKWIFAPASAVLMITIMLPFMLSNFLGGRTVPGDDIPPLSNEPVIYGEQDVETVSITQEYFLEKEEVILIDLSRMVNNPEITKESPREDSSIDVRYIFKDCLIPFIFNGNQHAFYMTYQIKVYEHYSFVEEKFFKNLVNQVTAGERYLTYQLYNTKIIKEAFAHFSCNGSDYYIYIREAQSVWELNDAALQAFLLHVFS